VSRVYALCTERWSPIAITRPKVIAIYESAREAKAELKRRNDSTRTRNDYWIESIPFLRKAMP
jgi:hypothetical protein